MALSGLAPGLRTTRSITIAQADRTCACPNPSPRPCSDRTSTWLRLGYLQYTLDTHCPPTIMLGSKTCFYSPFSFRATNRIINDNSLHRTLVVWGQHTNNNNNCVRESTSPVQPAPLRSPTHPHHQCRPTTTTHTLKQPPGDLDFGRPSQTPAGSYSYRTVTEPRLIQSQAIQSKPGQPAAHQCASVSLDCPVSSSSPSSPPVPCASPPCPVSPRLSTCPAVSSRLVPCHRPRLFCNLAPIWSCHPIFTALPTPDSVACLLAAI